MNNDESNFVRLLMTVFGFFLIVSSSSCSKRPESSARASIPYEEIEIEPLFDLESLDPAVEVAGFDKFFAVEQEKYVYFCDVHNHRILKYDLKGRFIREIGGLGQGRDDLYWPYGIVLEGGNIVVLNSSGREIKTFDENGRCISKFELPGARESKSFVATRETIVTDMKYEDEKLLRQQSLLTSYAAIGERLHHFGRSVPTNSMGAQLSFNTTRLGLAKSTIFGAFFVYPAVFGYKLNGEEIFFRLLADLRIPEIDSILEIRRSDINPSKPNYQNNGLSLTFLCANILTRSENSFLYAVNNFPYLIAFDGKGIPTKRIQLKYGVNKIYNRSFTLGKGNTIYGILYAYRNLKPGSVLARINIAER